MDLNEYQQQIVNIWENKMPPDELLLFCCAGMEEESGEAQGKVKRWMRGEGLDRVGYLKELGDVLAYLVMAAYSRGIQLNSSMVAKDITVRSNASQITLLKWTHILIKQSTACMDAALMARVTVITLETVLDQIVWCAAKVDSTLEEVMQLNLDKLNDRIARNGTVRGSGDNR